MLTFNGKTFAKNTNEFTSSLFNPGGTCSGFYKKTANGVRLYDLDNKLTGFLVNSKRGHNFVVSAGINSDGKAFFMNGASSTLEKWLGIEGMTITNESDAITAALATI